MKMVKKILLGTLAVAAILSIASCKREEGGNSSIITVNAGSSSASIDYTNGGDAITRGFKTLQTKHTDAICKLSAKVTGDDCDGVMGYIFDYLKNDDETLNFTIAGLRLKKYSSNWKAEAYVETYRNVDPETLESGASFKKKDGTSALVSQNGWTYATDDAFGKEILPKTGVPQDYLNQMIATAKANDAPVDIWVELVANDGTSAGRDETKGTYTVNFYCEDPKRAKDGNALKYGDGGTTSTPSDVEGYITSATIGKANVNTPFDTATALPQTEQGFYATVYAGQTLKGEWKFEQIKQEAEEIVE